MANTDFCLYISSVHYSVTYSKHRIDVNDYQGNKDKIIFPPNQ